MSKEAYYFSHDSNARHDPKILGMRSDYGVFGYGVYWMIIEMLREEEDFLLPYKNYIWNAIAMQVQCNNFAKDDAKQFVDDCINEYELLASDGENFWSDSLLKRMEKKNSISEKRRQAANKRWKKSRDDKAGEDSNQSVNASAVQNNANAMQDDARKGNEKKGNEKKGKGGGYDDDDAMVFFDKNIARISEHVKNQILSWVDDMGEDVVLAAMKKAADNDATTYSYVSKILIDWHKNSLRGIEQVRNYELRKQNQKTVPFRKKPEAEDDGRDYGF